MGGYPWTEVFLLEIFRVLVFYPTRHNVYRIVVLVGMVYLTVQIYRTPEVTDPVSLTYTVGGLIPFYFAHTAHLLWGEGAFPDHWRRVRDEVHTKADASGLENLPSNFPFMKKLWWMLDIAYGIRMVGWIQESRGIPPPLPQPSRRSFLWKTFLKLIINTVLVDLTTLLFAGSPAWDSRVHDPTDGPETYFAAVPLLHRPPHILAFAIRVMGGFTAIYNIAALVCVGLFHSSPALWPDIEGSWEDSYTLRKFWGQSWHQRVRLTVTGLGRLVANKFMKFPRGTNGSSYVQLYLAFFLTGVLHFSGDYMFERRVVYRSFTFFLLQAVAITFEDFVISLGRRFLRLKGSGSKSGDAGVVWVDVILKVIGYSWVILWFCLTLPIWIDEASVAGFSVVDRGPTARLVANGWKQLVLMA